MTSDIDSLRGLCAATFGAEPVAMEALAGGGGDRRYFRFSFADGRTVVGVLADNRDDARAFVGLSGVFREHGVAVPEVYSHSDDFSCYIQQDLGDCSLFKELSSPGIGGLVAATMRGLVKMQTVPGDAWSGVVAYKPFSRRQVMWDLNYFKYEFLKNTSALFDEERLEDDFEAMAESLCEMPEELMGFMMRDCQSRNVMLAPDPVFIDFQGGRRGPCVYDAVSFLWQAKAGFTAEFREDMLRLYTGEFVGARGLGKDFAALILQYGKRMALFRTLQVLGAYGFRGLVQKRAHFVESIPGALRNLSELVADGVTDPYPEIEHVCRQLVEDPRFKPEEGSGLRVKVFSFSYKRGYPEDLTGNGGGFMFDCRGMHNPGRYDEYKPLTGRDKPVIDFLRERGEADLFAQRATEMVSPTVDRYIKRGFSSLQIGFGCTGGRHRSVYCAEAVAHALAARLPAATVEVIHREQNIQEALISKA